MQNILVFPHSSGLDRWHEMDAADAELTRSVHPPEWRNPTPAPMYDLVVLGGGTAGLVSAMGAAGLGARVALVERHLLGGDCLNTGCVPSKALIRSARVMQSSAAPRRSGCTIVARHAGEMIGEATYAIAQGGTLGALSSTVHPYPTQAEALRKAGDVYRRESLTPGVRRWLERYFRWTR